MRTRSIVPPRRVPGKPPSWRHTTGKWLSCHPGGAPYARRVSPTYPMLVGGRLRRADAGRGRPVHDATGAHIGFATTATGADVTDAVAAARAALPGWSDASAHDRGRVLVEAGELLDDHRDRFDPDGIDEAVDRWFWYAGWTDKIAGVVGSVHPVAGPYTSWSAPLPVGVVGALAPPSLLGLVDVLGPVLATGATAVVVAAGEQAPVVAALAELLATTDLPAGVVNLLTGDVADLGKELIRAGVKGVDLAGAPPEAAAELTAAAAARGVRTQPAGTGGVGLSRLRAWSEVTTVWHPVGR
jgi:acyl-CoA reductase-like NAD-dependent aldehyde dehydrogenase